MRMLSLEGLSNDPSAGNETPEAGSGYGNIPDGGKLTPEQLAELAKLKAAEAKAKAEKEAAEAKAKAEKEAAEAGALCVENPSYLCVSDWA